MRKIVRIGAFLIVLVFFALLLCACTNENTEPTEDYPTGSSANSIVLFLKDDEKCQKLIDDMRSGNIPASVDVLYDQMGSRPVVTVTDSKTIAELYDKFTRITVGNKTNDSVTDSYHFVNFHLQDGTEVSFSFESNIWQCQDGNRYNVENTGAFWKQVQELQDKEMGIEE